MQNPDPHLRLHTLISRPSGMPGMTQDDHLCELLWESGTGNIAAFAHLHRIVLPRLRRYATRLAPRGDLADDIVQESMMAIWRQAASFDVHHAGPMTWMMAIVRHKAYDHFRAYRVRMDADLSYARERMHDDMLMLSPCSLLEERQRAAELARCLARLLDARRWAIELAYMQELTHEEVAASMSKPLGTIKSWIRRGMLDLRRHIATAPGAYLCPAARRQGPA